MSIIFICVISCSLGIFCCSPNEEVTEIIESEERPKSAVIFLHGTGESGPMMRKELENLIGSLSQFPHIRFIFPTAKALPLRPYPWNGQVTNTWIDADINNIDAVYNVSVVDATAAELDKWLEDQVASGVALDRICVECFRFLPGFSNGAIMSMIFGYQYNKRIGCVGSIAGYVATDSAYYQKLRNERNYTSDGQPPLYIAGGYLDFVVSIGWMKKTAEHFRSTGVHVTENYDPYQSHSLYKEAVEQFFKFILQTIT